MSWTDKIPGCLGPGGMGDFGAHTNDEERARELLKAAKKDGASIEDVAREVEDYLKQQGHTQVNIDEQIKRVRDPMTYA